jgi:hypothetical protein
LSHVSILVHDIVDSFERKLEASIFSVLGTNKVSLGGIKNMKVFKRVVGDGFLVLNTLI